MLNHKTSREALDQAVGHATIVLGTTPDDPDYVNSANAMARLVLALSDYLTSLDAKTTGQPR